MEEKLSCSESLEVLPSSFTMIPRAIVFFQTLNASMVYWVRGEEKNDDSVLNGIGNV